METETLELPGGQGVELPLVSADNLERNIRAVAQVMARQQPQNLAIVGGHVATDCTKHLKHRLLVVDDFTLDAPTSLFDGELVMWEFTQSGEGGAITLDAKFITPSAASAVALNTTAGHTDILCARYRAPSDKMQIVSFLPDYPS